MIKRLIAMVLCMVFGLVGCSPAANQQEKVVSITEMTHVHADMPRDWTATTGLDDPQVLRYVEDLVYQEAVNELNSDDYVVEDVQAVYVSKEYIEESAYNSQSNIYFGYTLTELNDIFEGKRYLFTLGDNGKTTVQELQEIQNADLDKMLKNVLIGSGVILVCVTVSVVSGGVGAPAVSAVFAASASSALKFGGGSAMLGGLTAGCVRYLETGDLEEATDAALLAASEDFKTGVIVGAVGGGVSKFTKLHRGTKGGLTMNQVAMIQKEKKLPIEVISKFKNMDEYKVFQEAGLQSQIVNGRTMLTRDISLQYKSFLPDGSEITNLERMKRGLSPIDPSSGKPFQLHHIGQMNDSPLAILTETEHQMNSSVLHTMVGPSQIDRQSFAKIRQDVWKSLAQMLEEAK